MFNRYAKEKIYIAGPVCFYPRGYSLWDARRRDAEWLGFGVSLPNDTKLELENIDLRKNADAIFKNCADSINVSTSIVADLELFRGSEPDGGTVFEVGMAYARGIRCYAFTRDIRPMNTKHQAAYIEEDTAMDGCGLELPYGELPFCPSLVGSCKIIEGDFHAAVQTMMTDINEEAKKRIVDVKHVIMPGRQKKRPLIYLSGSERYAQDTVARYDYMRKLCDELGYDVVTPADGDPIPKYDDPYAIGAALFERWEQHVRECDILVADLNDFHGWEPSSDVAFECGMAWQLGKKCYGYMSDTSNMQSRIPHYSTEKGGCDISDNTVENFNYPINLMFASSMIILQGSFEEIIKHIE